MATFYVNPNFLNNGDGTSPLAAASPGATGAFNTWVGVTMTGGNSYLQRRGTVYNAQVAPGSGSSLSSMVTLGAYSNDTTGADDDTTQARPLVSSFSLIFKAFINIRDFNCTSTTSVALSCYASRDCNFTNMTCTGNDQGVNISANSYSGGPSTRRLTFTNVDGVQTGGSGGGYAGWLLNGATNFTDQAVHGSTTGKGGGIESVTFTDCTASGIQGWYGSSGYGVLNANSSLRNILHIRCKTLNTVGMGFYYTPAVGACNDWDTTVLGGTTDAWCYNISFDSCSGVGSGNANMSIASMGGYCVRGSYSLANTVEGPGQSSTGGIQFICRGYLIYDNDVFLNTTNGPADGAGIFLDTLSAFNYYTIGCIGVAVIGNRCWGQLGGINNNLPSYISNGGPNFVTPTASGIRTYKAQNCLIAGNLCYGNAGGIGIDGFSTYMTVVNNTCADNWGPGISESWVAYGSTNVFKNNILLRNYAGVWTSDLGDFSTEHAGTLTLSKSTVGGGVTATSTASDFAVGNHNANYAIREIGGPGFAIIQDRLTDTTATIDIRIAFSTTSFVTTLWKKTGGNSPDADFGGYNLFYGNTIDRLYGLSDTSTITVKGTDLAVNPQLGINYVPSLNSPVVAAGIKLGATLDAAGNPYYSIPSIGGFEPFRARVDRT